MQHDHCRIQWVDDNGKPTPDENPPVGFAVHVTEYTRGTAADGSKSEAKRWPICAQHKAQGDAEGLWGHRDGADLPGCAYVSWWTFEPLP